MKDITNNRVKKMYYEELDKDFHDDMDFKKVIIQAEEDARKCAEAAIRKYHKEYIMEPDEYKEEATGIFMTFYDAFIDECSLEEQL